MFCVSYIFAVVESLVICNCHTVVRKFPESWFLPLCYREREELLNGRSMFGICFESLRQVAYNEFSVCLLYYGKELVTRPRAYEGNDLNISKVTSIRMGKVKISTLLGTLLII